MFHLGLPNLPSQKLSADPLCSLKKKKKKQNSLQEDNGKDNFFLVIKAVDLTKNNAVKSTWISMASGKSTDDVKNRIFPIKKIKEQNNWNCLPS